MSPFWITMLIVGLAAACAESYRCGVERGWLLGRRDGRDEAIREDQAEMKRILRAIARTDSSAWAVELNGEWVAFHANDDAAAAEALARLTQRGDAS